MRPPATKGNKKRDKLGERWETSWGTKRNTSCETMGEKGDKTSEGGHTI